jgi:hypothetical protein
LNPQAFDRFSYVLNNPLIYIDPSGNDYCQSVHADPEECAVIDQDGDGLTDPPYIPDPNDPVELNYWGNNMLDLYLEMLTTLGWWNDNTWDNFTVDDFLILILAYEFQPYINGEPIPGASRGQPGAPTFEEDLTHASTHSFYAQCASQSPGQVCSGMTANAIFNYVGALASGRGRYNAMQNGTLLLHMEQGQANIPLAAVVVNAMQNAPMVNPEWIRTGLDISNWVSEDEPWSWGNGSMLAISLDDITPNMYLWILPGENPKKNAYLFTVDQCKQVGCGTNR